MLMQSFQSFDVKMNLFFFVSSSIQGFHHKIQVLLLHIQEVFKEKIIFKEFSRT